MLFVVMNQSTPSMPIRVGHEDVSPSSATARASPSEGHVPSSLGHWRLGRVANRRAQSRAIGSGDRSRARTSNCIDVQVHSWCNSPSSDRRSRRRAGQHVRVVALGLDQTMSRRATVAECRSYELRRTYRRGPTIDSRNREALPCPRLPVSGLLPRPRSIEGGPVRRSGLLRSKTAGAITGHLTRMKPPVAPAMVRGPEGPRASLRP